MPGEHQEEAAPRACCGTGDLPGLVLRPGTRRLPFYSIHSAQAVWGPTPHPQTPRCPCPTQQRTGGMTAPQLAWPGSPQRLGSSCGLWDH